MTDTKRPPIDANAPTVAPDLNVPLPGTLTQASGERPPSSGNVATARAPLTGRVDALAIVDREYYEVLAEFGRGGLGRVLRARDLRTGRIVAIKEVLRSSPSLLARFAREAIVTANLQHPAIIPVYEVGRWPSGEPFYAMKLVAGRSLADVARSAKTLRDRLGLMQHVIDVADALAYAHGERVIHRDLKPANVLIGDYGETVVIDWGLAKRLDHVEDIADASPLPSDGHTTLGSVLGTPGYMAPEQARGETADARADVYAIGAMLYEVLSRVRPYSETTEINEVIRLAASEPPRPLGELAPEVPADLIAIVARAMAFAPADRYRDAKELSEDLKRFQTGQLVGAHAYSAWMLLRRWLRRHRAAVAVTAVGVVALCALGALSFVGIRAARDRAVASQAIAEDRAAALLEEQGRQLTISGDTPRALPYLAAAVEAGRSSPALAFVLARALDVLDPVEAVLTGSKSPVLFASYSPDGSRLVTGGDDLAIRLWDPHTHHLLRTLGTALAARWSSDGSYIAGADQAGVVVLHDPVTGAARGTLTPAIADAPMVLAISDQSDRIAVAGAHGVLSLWNATGGALACIHAHSAEIDALVFSRDGTMIATASQDKTAKVWRASDGALLATLRHTSSLSDIAFAPDGKRVITTSIDGAAVWDLATSTVVFPLVGHKDTVNAGVFDPKGTHVLTGSADNTVAIWDAGTGKQVASIEVGHKVLELRFSPDGSQFATRDERGDIKLWTAAGVALATFSGHATSTNDFVFSSDGKQLASAGGDGDVRLWRVHRTYSALPLDNAGTVSWRGTFSPDGTRIAIGGTDGIARLYDGESGALVRELRGHTGPVVAVAFSPDGTRLATASEDTTARIWDLATGSTVTTLAARAQKLRSVGYSPDGTQLATTHGDNTARLWNAASGAPLATLEPSEGAPRVALWSPDGTRILTPLDGPGAILWDASGRRIGAATMKIERAVTAAWARDGSQFVIGSEASLVATFEGHTAAARGELFGHTLGPVMAIEASPDGTRVATAAGDGIARLWQGTTQRLAIGSGLSRFSTATYRPDGALLATGDLDGQISVWEVATGKEVGRLGGSSGITQAHWSPDGRRLLALRLAGPPTLWLVPAWHGTAVELTTRLRCTLRWRLDNATLVPATPDPTACR